MNMTEPLIIRGRCGSVQLPNRLILAPMAGVSDLPFRLLCHEQGAGLVCMEMISAKAVCYRNRNTADLMRSLPEEAPVSMQLFGHEPEVMAEAVDRIEEGRILPNERGRGRDGRDGVDSDAAGAETDAAAAAEAGFRPSYDLLDINMGCPAPKIVNNGEGSALMKDPSLIEKLVRAAVEHSSRPVTVKLRTGFDAEHQNAVECALAAEEGGASAVGIHGRTRAQMYSGRADWSKIAEVKEALHIPVFGNGDVTDGPSARRMMEETGCDAVMIGRAAQGNPWIFRRILAYEEARPSAAECREMILRHAGLQLRYRPPLNAMREMRKHVAWYLAGFPGAARMRARVNEVESYEELEALLTEYLM